MFPLRHPFGVLLFCSLLASTIPQTAHAHSFGTIYTPPLPFWMYAYAAAAALLASFLVFGLFMRKQALPADDGARSHERPIPLGLLNRPWALWLLRGAGLGLLALCISTGLFGSTSPYGNFNMSFFWIVFALGGLYLSAMFGDAFHLLNPWNTLASLLGKLIPQYPRGIFVCPEKLAIWPAFFLYLGFIWIELFGGTKPYSLSLLLLAYTGLNLLGVLLIGQQQWFSRGEFFNVMFAQVGRLSPLIWQQKAGGLRLSREPWLHSLSTERTSSFSLLMFILFMLSSTAFDGLKETLLWHRLFWVDLYHAGLKNYSSPNPLAAIPQMREWANWWHSSWLLLSPWIYFALYGVFVALGKLLSRSQYSVKRLAMEFGYSLIPIALVYHLSHYYTLIQTQGIKIIKLASDPFSWGWDIFGTATWLQRTIIPDHNIVWHVQISMIVAGHILSVYLAHRIALRIFPNRTQAVLSQLPMLILMLIFTVVGLWVLSLPLTKN